MKKAIAFTYASDDIAYYFGDRVKKSFEHFHSDVPFHILTLDQEEGIFGDVMIPKIGSHFAALSTRYLAHLKKEYEIVMKIDADVVITGRLDEFLDGEYDVACSLNCKDVPGIDYERYPDYCNLGLTAVRSQDFADEWFKLAYDPEFINKNSISYLEQGVMNYLAFGGKYKALVVDKEGCYYNETSREYWDRIKVRHQGLFIDDRKVKAMHWAGGGELSGKYSHPAFSLEVCKYLDKVTDTKDFTDAYQEAEVRS